LIVATDNLLLNLFAFLFDNGTVTLISNNNCNTYVTYWPYSSLTFDCGSLF